VAAAGAPGAALAHPDTQPGQLLQALVGDAEAQRQAPSSSSSRIPPFPTTTTTKKKKKK
jgi:hypothetical protein